MDGAVGFTQCPIPSNENFTYRFKVDDDQAGTFWYDLSSPFVRNVHADVSP
jgi:FtsP/CotA-like multicopper oxidase with cupredoxin domain